MAIYKLDELSIISRGKGKFYKRHLGIEGNLNGLHYGKLYKKEIIKSWKIKISDEFYRGDNVVNKGDILLIDVSESFDELGHFVLYSVSEEAMAGNHTLVISANHEIVLSKYLFYKLKLSKQKIRKYATGDKVASISLKDFSKIELEIPPLEEQQKIIDIIEPLEKSLNVSNDLLSSVEKITKNTFLTETNHLLSEVVEFKKGKLPGKPGETLFLNVAAANGNKNRYVENKANVFKGDVTLSLDGNTGLVNNNLEGYNGYLYKMEIINRNVKEYEIYYSLKSKINQRIIKSNETGTTIKHAPGAKKYLKFLDIPREFEFLYEIEITVKNIIEKIVKLEEKMISILIK